MCCCKLRESFETLSECEKHFVECDVLENAGTLVVVAFVRVCFLLSIFEYFLRRPRRRAM